MKKLFIMFFVLIFVFAPLFAQTNSEQKVPKTNLAGLIFGGIMLVIFFVGLLFWAGGLDNEVNNISEQNEMRKIISMEARFENEQKEKE